MTDAEKLERKRARDRAYYRAHKEQKQAYNKQYYQKNKERMDRQNKEWEKNNWEKCLAYARQYRERLNQTPEARKKDRERAKAYYHAHIEERRAYDRMRRKRDCDKLRAKAMNYYLRNRESIMLKMRLRSRMQHSHDKMLSEAWKLELLNANKELD